MHINRLTIPKLRHVQAFTLVEVVISLAIAVIIIAGIIYGYMATTQRAEWSAYSLAAHSVAMQRLEQIRAAKFTAGSTSELQCGTTTNLAVLDTTLSGQEIVVTNFTTITNISSDPSVTNLVCIRVDCVWSFAPRNRLFTNTMVTYRAKDY